MKKCLESHTGECKGDIIQYMSDSGLTMLERCDHHYNIAQERAQEVRERYPYHQPSDFDPAYAGERWDDDY